MERTNELENELCSFPSYLNSFEDFGTCSKKKLKQLLDRIASELETYDNEIEKIRDLNLLAFLHHELGVKETALQYVDQALDINIKSINALALKGWFLLKSVDIYECKNILKQLEPLRNDPTEMLHAKAEVAFLYTRLGIRFYDKAIEMFKLVFSELNERKIMVHPITFVVWKFRQALIIKRTLNFNNLSEQNKFDFTFKKVNTVLKEYNDIYESQTDSIYKARSLVEMGELVNNIMSQGDALANWNLRNKLANEYFKEALQLCDSDPFVLQRCGKYYRYQKDYDKSIELLRKSIELKCDSYGHHHLALALKKKLENSLRLSFPRRNEPRSRSTSSRRRRQPRDSGGVRAHNFHETPSSVTKSSTSALRHNQRKPELGEVMPSETDTYLNVTMEFEEKVSLSPGASRGHSGQGFPIQRSKERWSRGGGGSCTDFRRSRSTDYGTGSRRLQSRLSGSPQRCEAMSKQTRLNELLVKSPHSVISLEGADEHKVAEILEHLDKAYQINGNIGALYDKGLTLRALGRYDDALKVFKSFFEEGRSSLVYLAKAYEQSAFCMVSKLETFLDSEQRDREKITCNLQHCLSTCIEISYKIIIQKYPDFNYCWASQPMLEDILNKKERTKQSREELCDFYRKVQDYTKAIESAEDLMKLASNQEEKRAIRIKMVSDYYNQEQYDKAILTINLTGNQVDDLPLFSEIHLEGGFQAYLKDEFELAKIRLKNALIRGCGVKQGVMDEEEEVDNFDIFILCVENNEEWSRQVKRGLNNLGLQVTVNFDDLRVFETKSTGVVEVMKNSSHFICFLEQDNNSEGDAQMLTLLEVVRNVLVERGSEQILFIKKDQLTDIPINFMHCPSIQYDGNMANVAKDMKMEETQIQWLKSLLQVLVRNSHKQNYQQIK